MERQKYMVVLVPLIDQFDVPLQSNFVSPWIILGDYTVFKYTNLSSISVVFSWYFMKVSRKCSEQAPIFSRLQVYENIHEGFSSSITLKADFWNNVHIQFFSLVEFCFIEIRILLPVTLQNKLLQVRFLGISRTNTLKRCI